VALYTALPIFIFLVPALTHGQLLDILGKRVEQKAKQRIERKADRAIDKGLDEAEKILADKGKPNKQDPEHNPTVPQHRTEPQKDETRSGAADNEPFRIDGDFDFVSGAVQLFYDDFSLDALGDFPAKWNTNGSGEVVAITNLPGRWLRVTDNTISFPEIEKALPDNFTVEFDLYYPNGTTRPPITFGFSEVTNPASEPIRYKKLFYYRISHSMDDIGYSTTIYSGHETDKRWDTKVHAGKPIRVSIAVNAKRIRLYMNQSKIFDLPRMFEPSTLRNNFHFRAAQISPAPKDGFYIANLRIAETGMDTRSQLINQGKFSTTGIYFNTNAATIKPESAGILQEIASVLIENPSLRVLIVGHTDSDGEETYNMELSKARAANVKNVLSDHYGVAPSQMLTDGKGELQPVADNSTPAGKAENRRVEFIKQ